ncbi:MAG: hypothetical protein DI539_27735, partial [Flavobacterium psychrophilum]
MLVDKRVPLRYLFNLIKYEMLIVFILALGIHFSTEKVYDYLPEMPLTIATFLGTAISVLLSFKMSQSYDRWWEARKIWGAIVNDSRSLVLQLQAFVKDSNEDIKTIGYRQIAWCYCLGQSLRGLKPMENCEAFLYPDDSKKAEKHKNRVLGILQLNVDHISRLRKENKLSDFEHIQLNNTC